MTPSLRVSFQSAASGQTHQGERQPQGNGKPRSLTSGDRVSAISRARVRGYPVTTLRQTPAAGVTPRAQRKGEILAGWLSSTDHKMIGHMYLITSFFFFLCAGVMAHADADPAARPGPALRLRSAVQRAVHHARRDHAAAVRHPAVHRVHQRAAAAADRRARRGVPAAQPAQLLHLHLRRPDPAGQLPHPGRGGVVRLVRLLAADQRDLLARRRRRHVDHGPGAVRAGHDPGRR